MTLLGVMLLMSLNGRTVQAQVAEQDSLALVAFYHATDGPNWRYKGGWLTDPLSSRWRGVTVTGVRVTRLFLFNNLLTGSIPAELANLTNLEVLSLFKNQLTGSIPVELGNLVNLTDLILNFNPLSETLPLSLINLSRLTTFWFDSTNLCEPIDDAFQAWLGGISSVQSTGCTNVATEEAAEVPSAFALEVNYPNPFNPATTIRYALLQRAAVRLSVYDVQGRLVRVLVEAEQATGWHEVRFEAGALPSGVYSYRLEAGAFQTMRQMLLLR